MGTFIIIKNYKSSIHFFKDEMCIVTVALGQVE